MRRYPALPRFATLALAAVALAAFGLASSARAEEEAPPATKLEKHPYSDAKPGEFLRVKLVSRGDTKFLSIRVLGVKLEESKVFYDVWQTSEDGKEMQARYQPGDWVDIPKFEPKEGQEFKKDEMVWLEIAGKKLACRHIKILQQMNPGFPEPKTMREVWFTNDVPGSGKVQEISDNPSSVSTAVGWGTMSAEDLAKARAEYKLDEKPADKPVDKPADKPADAPKTPDQPKPGEAPGGGTGTSCGGDKGCGK